MVTEVADLRVTVGSIFWYMSIMVMAAGFRGGNSLQRRQILEYQGIPSTLVRFAMSRHERVHADEPSGLTVFRAGNAHVTFRRAVARVAPHLTAGS